MNMSDEQISMMPVEKRSHIIAIREEIYRSQYPMSGGPGGPGQGNIGDRGPPRRGPGKSRQGY